jgi:TRAP-type C4-dicarboxylate transport system permease small subunit
MKTRISSILDRTIDILAVFAGVLIVYLVVSVTVAIIMRGLRVGVIWMFEITEYCMLWLTFLAAPWVLKHEAHIRMELIVDRFSVRTQIMLRIATAVIGALICLILAGFGIKVSWDYYKSGYFLHTVLAPPIYPILVIVPIGCVLLFMQFLRQAHKYTGKLKSIHGKKI